MSRRIPPSMDEADTLLPIEISTQHVTILTQEEYDNFVEVCKNPPKASEQLKQLFRKYKGKNV